MPLEYTTTRTNPGVDPVLTAWPLHVPIDLFAAAVAAGLMVLAGLHLLTARPTRPQPMVTCTVGPFLGVILLSIGLTALFFDLSHRLYVWRLYLTFEVTSPMSWGSYLMLFSYGALCVNIIAHLPQSAPVLIRRYPVLGKFSELVFAQPSRVIALGVVNLGLGFALGIYTGTLLSTLRARPLWNSPLLGPLFLISGLAAAAALLHAVLVLSSKPEHSIAKRPSWFDRLARQTGGSKPDASLAPMLRWAVVTFLTLQLVVIGLYLLGMVSGPNVGQRASTILFAGPYALPFWVLVVGVGTAVPLVLQLLETGRKVRPMAFSALLVLIGAFALRVILVYAGQESHWIRVAGG
ncbi:MAG: polysulfide reductase [Verrucomicrobia bacterium]|nr:polysulfide reductase [Verrucomicrobiota bacterium]